MCLINVNKLKELRKKTGLTQSELATLLELSPDEIGQLERDKINGPKISTIVKYLDYFDVDIYWLLDREEIGFLSKIEKKVLRFIRQKKFSIENIIIYMERMENPDSAIMFVQKIHNKIARITDRKKAEAIWTLIKDV